MIGKRRQAAALQINLMPNRNDLILDHVEKLAEILATPNLADSNRRRKINASFERLAKIREKNAELYSMDEDNDQKASE
jgi:hypothetical protein